MRRFLKVTGWVVLGVIVLALGAWGWAYSKAGSLYNQQWTVHDASFPIPFPLRDDEVEALRQERIAAGADGKDPLAGVDLAVVARQRATERGKHLIESRVGCNGCHAPDYGGMVIVDAAIVGHWVSPNLTSGQGSITRGFTATDWDRAVRHGVRQTGQTSSMPSMEFVNLSDRELSDVVTYLQSVPPVDRDLGAVRFGPVFSFLAAFDAKGTLPAFTIDHAKPHPVEPPAPLADAKFGEHIVAVCRGCHGPQLSGGKMQGDPNMPIVANLTPHETGLRDWTEADFIRALREGKRKDGTPISEFMPWKAYGQMTDTEIKAVWAYLQTVPPVEKGQH